MTNINPLISPSARTAQTALGDPPAAPATTPDFEQLAGTVIQSIESLIPVIPGYAAPHDSTRSFVRGLSSFSIPFLNATVASVAKEPQLQAVQRLDVAQARQILQLISALEPASNTVRNFSKALDFTLAMHKANLTDSSLQVYAIAQALARDKQNTLIGQLVADMSRALGRARSKTRKSEEVPNASPGVAK